jgi:hypothetical protein
MCLMSGRASLAVLVEVSQWVVVDDLAVRGFAHPRSGIFAKTTKAAWNGARNVDKCLVWARWISSQKIRLG